MLYLSVDGIRPRKRGGYPTRVELKLLIAFFHSALPVSTSIVCTTSAISLHSLSLLNVPCLHFTSFLGYVDLLGTTYDAPTLATGFGAHIAQPLLREAYEAKAGIDGTGELLTAEEAEALLDDCMKVLFYRDARSINKVRHGTL